MDTATPPLESSKTVGKPPARVRPIDPDHDIDAKKTITWLTVVAAGVFVTVWLLFQLFGAVIREERGSTVEGAPTPQLDQLRTHEAEQLGAGENRISIEQAIEELAK